MYFDRHFSLITGYRFLLKDVIAHITSIKGNFLHDGQSILDIGCGQRPYEKLFQGTNYIGMDNYAEGQATPHVQGTIESIPFSNGSLEACMTVWVLDDVYEVRNGISEIARVLKPGGYYFAIENQATHQHNLPFDYFRFSPTSLKRLCAEQGMDLLECHSFGGDFANVGFSLIMINRKIWGQLRLDRWARPIYSIAINCIFRPLDKFFRLPIFKKRFEENSLGYFYVFSKAIAPD
jgi:SAM-dependent methyltransferase